MHKQFPARIAGNIFWMQRYRERADNVFRMARAIIRTPMEPEDVHPHEWGEFLSAMGGGLSGDAFDNPTLQESLGLMLWSRNNPTSAAESASRARFNAREAVDLLPREIFSRLLRWENEIQSVAKAPADMPVLVYTLSDSLSRSAAVEGAVQTQMRRDAPYRFARLGSLIERADNSARLLLECLDPGSRTAELSPLPKHRLKLKAITDSFGLTTPCNSFDEHRDPVGLLFSALATDAACPRSLAHCCASVSEEMKHLLSNRNRPVSLLKDARKISDCVSEFAGLQRHGERDASGFLNRFIEDNMKLSRAIEDEFGFSK